MFLNFLNKYKSIIIFTSLLLFFEIPLTFDFVTPKIPMLFIIFTALRWAFYYILILFWGISLSRKMYDKNTRKIMYSLLILMLFFITIVMVKYTVARINGVYDKDLEIVHRHLWYSYYFPLIFMPAICLFLYTYPYHKYKYYGLIMKIVTLIGIALVIMVLTNDLHSFVFKINDYSKDDLK